MAAQSPSSLVKSRGNTCEALWCAQPCTYSVTCSEAVSPQGTHPSCDSSQGELLLVLFSFFFLPCPWKNLTELPNTEEMWFLFIYLSLWFWSSQGCACLASTLALVLLPAVCFQMGCHATFPLAGLTLPSSFYLCSTHNYRGVSTCPHCFWHRVLLNFAWVGLKLWSPYLSLLSSWARIAI
jgi:hypothetical protein